MKINKALKEDLFDLEKYIDDKLNKDKELALINSKYSEDCFNKNMILIKSIFDPIQKQGLKY